MVLISEERVALHQANPHDYWHEEAEYDWYEASLSPDPAAALKLLYLLEKLSDEIYHAGWLTGWEASMWVNPPIENAAELSLLSQQCQGWWIYYDYNPEHPRWDDCYPLPFPLLGQRGHKFLSLEEWEAIYQREWHSSYEVDCAKRGDFQRMK